MVCDGLLTGIVSTGKECGNPLYPGIYTNVVEFLLWIEENILIDSTTNTVTDENFTSIDLTAVQLPTSYNKTIVEAFADFFHFNSSQSNKQNYFACMILLVICILFK